jgi:hypothetical protein
MSSFNSAFLPFQAWWLLYVPPGLTCNNSTFCPHSVFMCFVWVWEQTAIISLYNINWLVCITETKCLLRGTDWIFVYISSSRVGCSLRISSENSISTRFDSKCFSEIQFLREPWYHFRAHKSLQLVPWASWVQSTPCHSISLRSILILCYREERLCS